MLYKDCQPLLASFGLGKLGFSFRVENKEVNNGR